MARRMVRWILAVLACLSMAALVVTLARRPSDLFLVARGPVPVHATQGAALQPAAAVQRQLRAGERAEVIACIDVKAYLIYEIRLADGFRGFVNEGAYEFERTDDRTPRRCRSLQ